MSSPGEPSDVGGGDRAMSAPEDPGTAPRPTGRANAQLRKTAWDMVRSMAVVLALVFVIVLLAWRPLPDEVKVVDPAPVIGMAVAQSDFPVLVPANLPADWRPTSARWQPTEQSGGASVLHIGYVTPTDSYAQVSSARVSSPQYLDEQTAQGAPTSTREITGQVWQEWESVDRKSLVLTDGEVSVVVSGTGEWAELEAMASSLQPAS